MKKKYSFFLFLLLAIIIFAGYFFFKHDYLRQIKLQDEPKIKVFLTYYKPYPVINKNAFVVPIQVGRAIENEPFMGGQMTDEDISFMHQNMIGDDTGDNISIKNRSFDVLTAFYWAWKHYGEIGNPQYIGFLAHRKRFLMQANDNYLIERDGVNFFPSEEALLKVLDKHKVITTLWQPGDENNWQSYYDNYAQKHNVADLEALMAVIDEKYPHLGEIGREVLHDHQRRYGFGNYFIMQKDLAFDYFEKLFDVMFELEKRIGEEVNQRDYEGRRAFGYLAERFFVVWLEDKVRKGEVSPMLLHIRHLD